PSAKGDDKFITTDYLQQCHLKSDPQKSLLNQQIYPSIKPGYHMNKKHWISVYPGEEISEALLRDLINDSWNLVVDGLAKRDQKRVRPG
ncbi:hypothetical protein HC484_16115, partial [Escherichia coli]|nr:hypothetical protein [Escherichia coli]